MTWIISMHSYGKMIDIKRDLVKDIDGFKGSISRF